MKLKWNSKKTEDSWRILKYNSEIVGGFEKLLKLGPSVSIFGSARIKENNKYYKLTVDIAKILTKLGPFNTPSLFISVYIILSTPKSENFLKK